MYLVVDKPAVDVKKHVPLPLCCYISFHRLFLRESTFLFLVTLDMLDIFRIVSKLSTKMTIDNITENIHQKD